MYYNKYIQSAHIVHRDIKPENILIDETPRVSLIDFGLSRQISADYFNDNIPRILSVPDPQLGVQTASDLTPLVVSRNYRAPELSLRQGRYNGSIDVFSVGCLIYELFETLKPLSGNTKSLRIDPLFTSSSDSLIENEKDDYETRKTKLNRPKEHIQHIIKILGTPSVEDINYIQDDELRNVLFFLLQYFLHMPPVDPMDWTRKLGFLCKEEATDGIDLMKRCLEFSIFKNILQIH